MFTVAKRPVVPVVPCVRTYYQFFDLLLRADGLVEFGNNGHCVGPVPGVPVIGPWDPTTDEGETIYSIDYRKSPPEYLAYFSTNRSSQDVWEAGAVRCDPNSGGALECAFVTTLRPPLPSLSGDIHGGDLTRLLLQDAGDPHQPAGRDYYSRGSQWLTVPISWLTLHGDRYLYVSDQRISIAVPWQYWLARIVWPQVGPPQLDYGSFPSVPWTAIEPNGFSQIVVQTDGSLLGLESSWPPDSEVDFWRSTDDGRTWKLTGQTIQAPEGKTIFDCHLVHTAGGAVVTPWYGMCNVTTGEDWGTLGVWTPTWFTYAGASIPASALVDPIAAGPYKGLTIPTP